jgi:hypothetical protein
VAAIVPVSADDLELAPRLTDPQAERLWRQIEGERASGASLVFDGPDKAVSRLAARSQRSAPRPRTMRKGGRGARRAR